VSKRRRVGAFVRGLLLRNLWLKLLSLLVALGFYGFIHGQRNVDRTVSVSLITYMPPTKDQRWQLMTQIPNSISVRVRGSWTVIEQLRGEQIDAIPINLTEGKIERFEFHESMINLPPNVQVERIEPRALELVWEEIVTREIPVRVARTGEPADGFEVQGDLQVEPSAIKATGPDSEVSVIQFIRAEEFHVGNLTAGTTSRPVALDRPPPFTKYEVTSVVVTVRVVPKLETVEFDRIKVDVVGLPRARTRPTEVRVVVTGPPERVRSIKREAIVARTEPMKENAELPQSGSAYLDVKVSLPDVTVQVDPPKVMVTW